ncbi:YdjC-like protein [Algoriphagus ratkowskyi]|uniref:ChbG/HpnK family deacetylase n=1 Tax=Algoriphagus ratkowskyi TaxID=57028 RepID=A0A2W7S1A9_9BACT|nr:ChbG/HpnK family deacetylase [Algoriphagus ratkowskyi]PZX56925.1 YdjC-like protein [Algoriphagus ratkowskyi]TXD79837.1 ChbG/HpnK family deacetylase [Algoriphagus ratkowskyi]
METYKGIVTQLVNTRIFKPSVNAPKSQELQIKWDVEISHAIRGEMYREIDIWYVLTNRTFVWSGAVFTSQNVPILSKQFLITADDIGVVKEIDLGAKLALKNGWINSIAVLVNRKANEEDEQLSSLYEFLENTNYMDSNTPLSHSTHVGLHYTITSGIPVSPADDVKSLVDQNGFFPEYKGLDSNYTTEGYVHQAMRELEAQYSKFKRVFKREPAHLTSHHDVHTFTYPLFKSIHAWAIHNKIPIRSHSFLPPLRREFYDLGVKLNLPSINTMNSWATELGCKSSAEHTMVGHYGPAPFLPLISYRSVIKKKQNTLDAGIFDFLVSTDQTREIMVHIIKSDLTKKNEFKQFYKPFCDAYPGVDSRYFAGRVAEYLSLQTRKSASQNTSNNYLVAMDFVPLDIRRV